VKHVRVIKIILGLVLIFSGIAKIVEPLKAVNLEINESSVNHFQNNKMLLN